MQWLSGQTTGLSIEWNLLAAISKLGQFSSLHIASVQPSCITEYLAGDSGGFMNNVCAVIAMWLNASQRS